MVEREVKGIIDGLSDDIMYISEEFGVRSPNLKLTDFFNLWEEMRVDCIFANRFDPRELHEAIREMNKLLVGLLIEESSCFTLKVTCLYFLLCIYIKQPNNLRRKIRLTCSDILTIQRLSEFSLEATHNKDAIFAWSQLKKLHAFDLVEERTIYGPSLLCSSEFKRDSDQGSSSVDQLRRDSVKYIEKKIEPALSDIEHNSVLYGQLRDNLSLDSYQDSTVDIKSNGTLTDFLNKSKDLISSFKRELGVKSTNNYHPL